MSDESDDEEFILSSDENSMDGLSVKNNQNTETDPNETRETNGNDDSDENESDEDSESDDEEDETTSCDGNESLNTSEVNDSGGHNGKIKQEQPENAENNKPKNGKKTADKTLKSNISKAKRLKLNASKRAKQAKSYEMEQEAQKMISYFKKSKIVIKKPKTANTSKKHTDTKAKDMPNLESGKS